MSVLWRAILSVFALFLYFAANQILRPVDVLVVNRLAGMQLNMTDSSYVAATVGVPFFQDMAVPTFVLAAVLIALWWRPLRRAFLPVVLFATLGTAHPALAYYQTSDYADPYAIMPNESAFWVPDVGDNKSSQTKMDSAAFLREKKIPFGLFLVPHVKLQGSGAFFNYIVPSGRLFILDRTPYSAEWVKANTRGTSDKDESFACQSKEGQDVTVGLSIGTYVTEDDAPLFLSHFGILPVAGNRTDPNVIFTSVYYGHSLKDVMDNRERPKVETLVCKEIMARTIDENNSQAGAIIDAVEKNVRAYLATRGITLDFIGWADTFTFSPIVQHAIDERYAAEHIKPVLDTLQQKAVIDAVTKTGWNGALPTTLSLSWWPDSLSDWMRSWFHMAPTNQH